MLLTGSDIICKPLIRNSIVACVYACYNQIASGFNSHPRATEGILDLVTYCCAIDVTTESFTWLGLWGVFFMLSISWARVETLF